MRPWRRGRLLRKSIGALALLILFGVSLSDWVGPAPRFESVRDLHRPSDVWLVDRNGVPLEALRTGTTYRSLEWVPYDQISPAFTNSLVKAEDRRFFRHYGVDPLAIGGSLMGFVSGAPLRGASTLTMQVAKSLEEEKTGASVLSRVLAKLRQLTRAVKIDAVWSKEEILEVYVNRVSFRGEVVGLRAASLGYFRKAPTALDDIESAILVVLLRAPNASPTDIVRRACRLVDSCDRIKVVADAVLNQPLQLRRERLLVPVVNHHFIEKGEGSSVIQTSLDAGMQRFVMDAVREQLQSLKHQNVGDAAAVVLETRTGRVVAYAANGGRHFSTAAQVDGVQSLRQVGSTIKPFVYGTAFDLGVITPVSLLLDSPENVSVGNGQVYQPRNYDHQFRGQVGAAEALGSSLNVPAVRVLDLVGERRVIDRLHRLGFANLKDDDQYGPSLALGTVDASLWEMANGYRLLSRHAEPQSSGEPAIYSDRAKDQIFESLSIAENRRFTFGVESILQLPFAAAVKTGTSKDMRDNWCIGFTSEYTVATWVGNFNGQPMWNVSGISGAAPLWRSVMVRLHRDRLPKDEHLNYRKPEQPLPQKTLSRIRYPVDQMLIGIDPDIPKRLQKVPLRAEGRSKGLAFYVNGARVGRADANLFWSPLVGRHKVDLRDSKGRTLDHVQFVVR